MCLTLVSSQATAQEIYATVSGTVEDVNGGTLDGVGLTMTSPETGLTRSVRSQENGAYSLTLPQIQAAIERGKQAAGNLQPA